jgi:integrase
LLILYEVVLCRRLAWMDGIVRAKRPERLPVVLTREEVGCVLAALEGDTRLVGSLLYGSGLRLFEALTLRVKDLDFDRRELLVRDGKGRKDRLTIIPAALIEPLRAHLERVGRQHQPADQPPRRGPDVGETLDLNNRTSGNSRLVHSLLFRT